MDERLGLAFMALLLGVVLMATIAIAVDTDGETQQMKACVESGQQWVRVGSDHECTP